MLTRIGADIRKSARWIRANIEVDAGYMDRCWSVGADYTSRRLDVNLVKWYISFGYVSPHYRRKRNSNAGIQE